MQCPACGTENKPEAAFCMSCGAPLPETPFAQVAKGEPAPGGADQQAPTQAGAPAEGTIPVPWTRQETPQPTPPPVSPPVPEAPAAPAAAEAPPPPVAPAAPPLSPREPGVGVAPPPPGETVTIPVAPMGPEPGAPPPVAPQAPAAPPRPSVVEEIIATPQPTPPPVSPPVPEAPAAPAAEGARAGGEGAYFVPPEADIVAPVAPAPALEPRAPEPPPPAPAPQPTASAGVESTQVIAPVPAAPPPPEGPRPRTVVCNECYAVNPENNSFCHECGSPLPAVAAPRAATGARPATAPPAAGRGSTMVLPVEGAGAAPAAYAPAAAPVGYARPARGDRSFGVTDVLALFAAGMAAVALALPFLLDSFSWKKGVELGMFSHQGAFSPNRYDLLGGPGILPYGGSEFFTIGLVVGVGLALAALFLLLRVGRGPMFLLAGCLLLFPLAYVIFQGLLPISVKIARSSDLLRFDAAGIRTILFGSGDVPGMGPPIWLITGAGLLLVVAGFAAPPRGWGRLFSFLLFFGLVIGIAFFCAACYNWSLFIPAQEASSLRAALGQAATASGPIAALL